MAALDATPHTFVHSNFKLDNLGTDDAGRTVVLDWEQPGLGAPLSDLGSWWERQLALCLLGALVQFGWEKPSAVMTRSWHGGRNTPYGRRRC